MATIRNLSTVLLLAGTSLAAPFYAGNWTPPKSDVEAMPLAATASPVLPNLARRDWISNGILYVTTTIVLSDGATAPAPSPTAVESASPKIQSTMTTSVAPVATTSPIAKTQAAASSPAATVASSPASSPTPAKDTAPSAGSLSADTIKKIMPLSGSCAGRDPQAGSCRTADQAAAPLAKAFGTYGITSKGAQAANLALIAYESGQMMYKVGLDPATPGKGTYAVMMPPNVKKYAEQLFGADAVTKAATPVAILALVNANDDDAFGSASWYMSTQCPDIQKQFDGNVDTAWTAYISTCVGGSDLAGRQPFWDAAKTAFGI